MPQPDKSTLPASWQCVVDALSTADHRGFSDLEATLQRQGHSFAPIANLMVLAGVIRPDGCQVAENLYQPSECWRYEDCYALAGRWWKAYRGLCSYERYLLDTGLHLNPAELLAKLPPSYAHRS
ncbi:hypothetical protein [Larkinella humicola]|uniref:Uncharacterized protein n=1 Tax=Larkinella humicola TaxID=2607654 RepID=A0A5N1JLB5_9BACT|nr:hypothetical protein [Larkinella humicola]KAA9357275.1 hypothetical protein F0P93_05935 [Larkinella humicola]